MLCGVFVIFISFLLTPLDPLTLVSSVDGRRLLVILLHGFFSDIVSLSLLLTNIFIRTGLAL